MEVGWASTHPTSMLRTVFLNDEPLQIVESFTYLGHVLSSDSMDDLDIKKQLHKIIAVGNTILRRFSFCTKKVRLELFRNYCYNIYCKSLFAKNVSSDSVNVSTLKGEGELTNLELNETVLTDLLELPIWLRITRALVNKVNLKIQWTKLKSVPIAVSLDEVQLEMETCSELRSHQSGSSVLPSYSSGGRYGFADKVTDGMTVTVNSVLITFRSHAFHATFQLSRIVLDSKNPLWQKADLRQTRLKDVERGEVLIFKEMSWQTLRVEAKSTCDQALTPLRLITNQARCRITIKKKLADCSVVGCRLVLLMDDLLWVLTDSQLTAAFHFMDSLSGLVRQAAQESQKTKAVRKLEVRPHTHTNDLKK
ncbi:UHRF1-binding protein 1-like [Chionoecetes opilio]|uniref:UHRF1-binding protein 1-like n=1 Tax=Chionoecetes opilio TaxID=41210 RepID=A0A8J8WBB5_CHIOP|nr:UHRF1-binding protein 1-like [Chionoecetes opilio]